MKGFTVVCLFALIAAAVALPIEKYTEKFDTVNVKEILDNDRLRNAFEDCVLEKPDTKCSPEGKELKSHIGDALSNGCAKCTDVQQVRVREVIAFLVNKKPEEWKKLCDKYDPERKYAQKYEDELRKIQKH